MRFVLLFVLCISLPIMAKADTEFLDVLCLHETTIMKYMDIMVKYPREPDKLQAMLEK